MTVPFKHGDRIRLKANHAIEAVVFDTPTHYSPTGFYFKLTGSLMTNHTGCPDEWERVQQPMPKLEPGMVVEYDGSRLLGEMKDAVSIAYCFGSPEQRSRITRVGRVEWIWERDDAN